VTPKKCLPNQGSHQLLKTFMGTDGQIDHIDAVACMHMACLNSNLGEKKPLSLKLKKSEHTVKICYEENGFTKTLSTKNKCFGPLKTETQYNKSENQTRRELSWGEAVWGQTDRPTNEPTDG
jgi:hypothetical protein